ncbi:PREDICTED: cuticle collagen 13-like [Chinchilla lanigera]|uniref:cuticle collagen 13-like n=1 Tax=Chinchilla lanigera TaxID=34839 RepID=UPI000698EC8E|nr:PREDICTED: cuticle collagen 13-like [Chinchilla lanigera]
MGHKVREVRGSRVASFTLRTTPDTIAAAVPPPIGSERSDQEVALRKLLQRDCQTRQEVGQGNDWKRGRALCWPEAEARRKAPQPSGSSPAANPGKPDPEARSRGDARGRERSAPGRRKAPGSENAPGRPPQFLLPGHLVGFGSCHGSGHFCFAEAWSAEGAERVGGLGGSGCPAQRGPGGGFARLGSAARPGLGQLGLRASLGSDLRPPASASPPGLALRAGGSWLASPKLLRTRGVQGS